MWCCVTCAGQALIDGGGPKLGTGSAGSMAVNKIRGGMMGVLKN